MPQVVTSSILNRREKISIQSIGWTLLLLHEKADETRHKCKQFYLSGPLVGNAD